MTSRRKTIFTLEETPINFGGGAVAGPEAPREPDAEELAQSLRDSTANW